LQDGLTLIAHRGRLMQGLPRDGAMLAVSCDAARLAPLVAAHGGEVDIAAFNAPGSVVLSGRATALAEIAAQLDQQQVRTHRLTVSHAFHSALMEPMVEELRSVAQSLRLARPRIPIISNLTGEREQDLLATADYWARHARAPVHFADSVRALGNVDTLIELGPSPILSNLVAQCGSDAHVVPSMNKSGSDWKHVLDGLASLYVRGADVDWRGVFAGIGGRRVAVPSYPFQRKRYWAARSLLCRHHQQ
jgi:pimaricinolide synthase PimS1